MSFYLEAKLILLSKCKLRYNMHKGKHLWYSLRKFSARSSEAEESNDMKLLFIIRANITILKGFIKPKKWGLTMKMKC